MANPFNNGSQGQKQASNVNINELLANMKKINNPKAIKQMIMNNNPQLAQMLNDIERSGMHPVQYIAQQAILRNINIRPEQIQQMFNEISSQFN